MKTNRWCFVSFEVPSVPLLRHREGTPRRHENLPWEGTNDEVQERERETVRGLRRTGRHSMDRYFGIPSRVWKSKVPSAQDREEDKGAENVLSPSCQTGRAAQKCYRLPFASYVPPIIMAKETQC